MISGKFAALPLIQVNGVYYSIKTLSLAKDTLRRIAFNQKYLLQYKNIINIFYSISLNSFFIESLRKGISSNPSFYPLKKNICKTY